MVEIAESEQTSVGRDSRTVEFQLEAMIEGDPESGPVCFTRRIVHL
jgi:hypothetical protein